MTFQYSLGIAMVQRRLFVDEGEETCKTGHCSKAQVNVSTREKSDRKCGKQVIILAAWRVATPL